MKNKNLLFSLFTLILLGTVVAVSLIPSSSIESISKAEFEENDGEGIAGALAYYHKLKANPYTGEIENEKIQKAGEIAKKLPSTKAISLNWSEMGPNNVGGRVRAILIDNSNSSIMYAGGVNGGLWKSTTSGQSWVQIPLDGNNAVVSICQSPNGDIYVGTGEGLAQAAYSNYNTGTKGEGIYRKAASSTDFIKLTATTSWTAVNRLASDKNNKVYAATKSGLFETTDQGASWTKIKPGSYSDVKTVLGTTQAVATVFGNVYITTDGTNWIKASGLPSSGIRRIEVAISPSDPTHIYAVLAANNGVLYGIYLSTNTGTSWTQIAVGGSPSFELFGPNNQGWYDIAAMVHKTNPDILYVGGVDMWKGEKVNSNNQYSWTKKTLWYASKYIPVYVHADQHVYAQHPTDANTFYAGTDGGISKTIDGGNSFATLNTNFNVTQFYAVAPHANGGAIAGAQDNGTQFMDLLGNNPMRAREVRGGDGFWCATSILNQDVIFASIYYGNVARSKDFGEKFQEPKDLSGEPDFYSADMLNGNLGGAFVTPTIFWETIHYPNSIDTVTYVADTNYVAGDTIDGRSKNNNFYPFSYILPQNMSTGDTIKIKDPVQSRLYVGTNKGIYMTKQALFFVNKTPEWFRVSTMPYSGMAVNNFRASKDGNYLYYSVFGHLRRLSNLLQAQDYSTADVSGANYAIVDDVIKNFGGGATFISSISIDPEDANRIVVTVSGTGVQQIYYSDNATSATPTFTTKRGNLPANLPVYASLIPVQHSQQTIIGTEYGLYATEDITATNPVWAQVNDGFDAYAPVYMIVQQQNRLYWRKTVTYDNGSPIVQVYPGVYNYGQIYLATHGRGVFTSKTYVGIDEIKDHKVVTLSDVNLYPNPIIDHANFDYKLDQSSIVIVNVFDINGRMINTYNLGNKVKGNHTDNINLTDLAKGMYIMQINAGSTTLTKKFIKR